MHIAQLLDQTLKLISIIIQQKPLNEPTRKLIHPSAR